MAITTDINYPSTFPKPQRDGHSYQHTSTFTRTDMDSGRARQRRRFSSVPTVATFKFIMTTAEFSAFEAWFRDTLADGVKWFNMSAYTPIGAETQVVCRFMEMYSDFSALGVTHWEFSVKLEFFERPLMPQGWGLFPDLVTRSGIIDIAMNEKWPEA